MNTELSGGQIKKVLLGDKPSKLILQIIDIKTYDIEGDVRLMISDGIDYITNAYLARKLKRIHLEGKLGKFAIIQLEKFEFKDSKLIILECTVLRAGNEVGTTLGNPWILTMPTNSKPIKNSESDLDDFQPSESDYLPSNCNSSKSLENSEGFTQSESDSLPFDCSSPKSLKYFKGFSQSSECGSPTFQQCNDSPLHNNTIVPSQKEEYRKKILEELKYKVECDIEEFEHFNRVRHKKITFIRDGPYIPPKDADKPLYLRENAFGEKQKMQIAIALKRDLFSEVPKKRICNICKRVAGINHMAEYHGWIALVPCLVCGLRPPSIKLNESELKAHYQCDQEHIEFIDNVEDKEEDDTHLKVYENKLENIEHEKGARKTCVNGCSEIKFENRTYKLMHELLCPYNKKKTKDGKEDPA